MAFVRPTLPQLISRVEGDIQSGLGIVTLLRRSFLKIFARVLAGLAHSMYGFFEFMERQYFEDTAEAEYLQRKAGIWGLTRNVATFMEFDATATGTNGTVIPAGTIFKRADMSQYSTVEEVTIVGGTATVRLVANIAGQAYEVNVGDALAVLSPIAGLGTSIFVSNIIIESEDAESDDSLRSRLLFRMRNPISGGSADDYIYWARSVPGITRTWVKPLGLGPGTVVVYVVSDDEDPITPSPAKIAEVAAYIETVRPVTANVYVVAPVLFPIDMTIQIKPNTVAVHAAVIAELEDLILREAALAGSYKGPGTYNDGRMLLSRINEAISLAVGEEDHVIVEINGAAPADIAPNEGELIVLGEITWQALA